MKVTLGCFIILLLTVFLICDQNGVEAKKKKGKGGDKYQVKNNYKEKKEHIRKTRGAGDEYNTKEEKRSKIQEDKNKYNNEFSENDYIKVESKNKYDKKKENTNKKTKNNKSQIKEEIKKEYKNKKTEAYSKKTKANSKYENEEGLNGRSYDLKHDLKEKKTLIIEDPKIILDKDNFLKEIEENNNDIDIIESDNGTENEIEEPKIIAAIKANEKENCDKCNRNKVNDEKLLQCNKKTDSIERNTTKICENYKSEKNTEVFEEKIVSDKQVASNILDKKQPKCEL